MGAILLKLLNMSITAGWLVLAVIIVRFLFRNMPKTIRCVLWALVAIRLICPISIESALSLVPSSETIPQQNLFHSRTPAINSGIHILNSTVNPMLIGEYGSNGEWITGNIVAQTVDVVSYIWVVGVVIISVYAVLSYVHIRRKVQASIKVKDNIYICDNIDTPFILGVIRPRIYLPSYLSKQERECVLAHEQAHLMRRDHWWKLIGFVLLIVYWFNPLMWLAYTLLCKDIELACDEQVIKDMDSGAKKLYSEVLLSCGTSRRVMWATPLAFGEVSVKTRIKSVLKYKKPTLLGIIAGAIVCVVLAVAFLTNPVMNDRTKIEEIIQSKGNIIETYYCWYKVEDMEVVAHLNIDYVDKTCSFAPYIFMSYMAQGEFEMEDDKIVISSRNGDKYTFRVLTNGLKYEGYVGEHNELGKVPKGALFELKGTLYRD